MLDAIGDFLFLWSAAGAVVFVILYMRYSDWQHTTMGRHIMIFMVVIAAALLYGVVSMMFELPSSSHTIARLIIWASICSVIWYRVYLLIKMNISKK